MVRRVWIEFFMRIATALPSVLLLVPVGILYLMQLSDWARFGVVIVSTVVFIMVISSGLSAEHLLVYSCAFVAVMVNFLAQVQKAPVATTY
jgi:hypothetical protein